MSRRLLRDEAARGTVKVLKLAGWPLRRTIQVVRLREAYSFRAVQQFLQLAGSRIPELRFVKTQPAELDGSARPGYAMVRPTAGAIMRSSAIRVTNCSGKSDCGPSLRACSGS